MYTSQRMTMVENCLLIAWIGFMSSTSTKFMMTSPAVDIEGWRSMQAGLWLAASYACFVFVMQRAIAGYYGVSATDEYGDFNWRDRIELFIGVLCLYACFMQYMGS